MRYEITITGMLAVHARHAVFTALAAVPGIMRADVELGRAVVEHDGQVTEAALRAAIGVAGFEVTRILTLPRTLPIL
jgi:copper chaperone CopZ